jgi:hypothetical protein
MIDDQRNSRKGLSIPLTFQWTHPQLDLGYGTPIPED